MPRRVELHRGGQEKLHQVFRGQPRNDAAVLVVTMLMTSSSSGRRHPVHGDHHVAHGGHGKEQTEEEGVQPAANLRLLREEGAGEGRIGEGVALEAQRVDALADVPGAQQVGVVAEGALSSQQGDLRRVDA